MIINVFVTCDVPILFSVIRTQLCVSLSEWFIRADSLIIDMTREERRLVNLKITMCKQHITSLTFSATIHSCRYCRHFQT